MRDISQENLDAANTAIFKKFEQLENKQGYSPVIFICGFNNPPGSNQLEIRLFSTVFLSREISHVQLVDTQGTSMPTPAAVGIPTAASGNTAETHGRSSRNLRASRMRAPGRRHKSREIGSLGGRRRRARNIKNY